MRITSSVLLSSVLASAEPTQRAAAGNGATAHDLFVKQPRRLATLDELFREKEERALALANLVSNEYEKRCGSSLGGCAASSHDECSTTAASPVGSRAEGLPQIDKSSGAACLLVSYWR